MSYTFEPTVVADFDSTTVEAGCAFALTGGEFKSSTSGLDPGDTAYASKDIFGPAGTDELWARFVMRVDSASGEMTSQDGTGPPAHVTTVRKVPILQFRDVDGDNVLIVNYEPPPVDRFPLTNFGPESAQSIISVQGNAIDHLNPTDEFPFEFHGPMRGGPAKCFELYVSHGVTAARLAIFMDGQSVYETSLDRTAGNVRYLDLGVRSERQFPGFTPPALDYRFSEVGVTNDRVKSYYGFAAGGPKIVGHTGFENGTPVADWVETERSGGLNCDPAATANFALDIGVDRGSYAFKVDSRADAAARFFGWKGGAGGLSGALTAGSGVALGFAPCAAASFWINVQVLPDRDVHLAAFKSVKLDGSDGTVVPAGALVLDQYGNLYADADGSDGSRTFGVCIAEHLGEWIQVELGIDTRPDNWTLYWRLNGVDLASDLSIPGGTFAGAPTVLGSFYVGNLVPVGGALARLLVTFDDIAVSRDVGDHPLGAFKHLFKKPNGVGTHQNELDYVKTTNNMVTQTVLSGDATSHTLIDEWPPVFSGASDGIGQRGHIYNEYDGGGHIIATLTNQVGSANPLDIPVPIPAYINGASYLEYLIEDVAADPISVTAYVAARDQGDDTNSGALHNGDGYTVFNFERIFGGANDVFASGLRRQPSGAAWTQAAWNAIRFRFGAFLNTDFTYIDPGTSLPNSMIHSVGFEILLLDSYPDPLPDAAHVQCALTPVVAEEGSLGCGDYQLSVWTRGLDAIVTELPGGLPAWERVVDDTSQATATVPGYGIGSYLTSISLGCGGEACFAEPWSTELVVHRQNSRGEWQRVWSGPIQKVVYDAEQERAEITARDLSAWWEKRRIHRDHLRGRRDPITDTYSQTDDVGTLFKRYADDAMQPDNSPHIIVDPVTTTVLTIKPVRRSQFLIAGDVLRELADSGVDWSVVDREVLLGETEIPGGPIGPLLPQHLAATPVLEVDGSQQVNDWVVKSDGTGPGGVSVVSTPDVDGTTKDSISIAEYGLLEAVTTAKVSTLEAANANAKSRLFLTNEPLMLIREVRLLPSAPFPISTLLAGVEMSFRLQHICGALPPSQRIQRVAVQKNERGEEQVVITFMPPGTTPA